MFDGVRFVVNQRMDGRTRIRLLDRNRMIVCKDKNVQKYKIPHTNIVTAARMEKMHTHLFKEVLPTHKKQGVNNEG